MIVYFNGRFLSKESVAISPDDRGFLLADGVYEVIRSYGGTWFRAQDHYQRLERGLQALQILCEEDFPAIAAELLQRNELADAKLYIQITRGVAKRSHAFPAEVVPPTVYAAISPFHSPVAKLQSGVRAILVPDTRWTRCNIKTIALLPNVLASQQAKEQGAEEAIFVREGVITEGSHTNCCAVFEGRLITHPATHHILPGIMRTVVLELCAELGLPHEERPIQVQRLKAADEVMIVGTTTEIMPVVQVDDWIVGDGCPGSVTRQLQRAFCERVLGAQRSHRPGD